MEMLVVITIIGLIVAVATPSISAGLDSVRMASATDSISAFLNAAVTHAERRQQPVLLVISSKESRFEAVGRGFQRELRLPDGIQLEDSEPERRIVLLPGATIPGIAIQIANHRGGRRIIRLDPMTGFPRVEAVGS
jgi:Tfp pilus assembly protein FimT